MSRISRPARRALQPKRGLVRAGLAAATTGLLVVVGATSAYAAGLPTGPSTVGVTGLRPGATRYSFAVSDRVKATVDVGTGNLNITADLLDLPTVTGREPIGVSYNSEDTTGGSGAASSMNGPAWTWGLAGAGSLSLQPNGTTIDWTTGDGAVWPFTLSGTVYTAPFGLKAMLVKTGTTYTLTSLQTSQIITFDLSGNPTSIADRNGNTTAISISSSTAAKVTSTAGPNPSPTNSARVANLSFAPYLNGGYTYYGTTIAQASGSSTRSAFVGQASSGGVVTFVTDAAGDSTQFTYNSSNLVSHITNPDGEQTSITYDSSKRVTRVDQANTTTGSAGTSTTRFSYASGTSTLVAGPNTDTATAVATVPHATYTLNGNDLATAVTDAAGRQRSTSYNANLDVSSATVGATGTGSNTTTYGYGSNGGLSLDQGQNATGNQVKAGYTNTNASSQYLPSSTTADTNGATGAQSSTFYGYDSNGNQTSTQGNSTLGSTQTSNPSTAATATVTRNPNGDGTITAALAPGNGSNKTLYGYNGNHQLASVTPVTGSSLGVKNYTYDDWARLKTATDGAGNTTSYTYDDDDRVLTTSFSDSTATVTNTYDSAGNLTQQVSSGGTITNTFDQLNQLVATANTSFGGTISYGYDKAGNNTSISDTRGTTTQTFDDAGALVTTTYPKGSGTSTTQFATDANGNRTDVWLQANASHTSWAAHTHTAYDQSGRVKEIKAEKGPASGPTTQMDVYYCYNTAGSGTACGTATASDKSKLQWTYNAVTSQTTKFAYDGMGRLLSVTESGGTDGNNIYAYTYDARGNRLTANVSGTDSSSQTLTYNAANQITSSGYSYDGAGNMTASPGATYTYNAAEQMTKAVVGGNTTTYTYAGAAQNAVLRETVGGGSTYKLAYGRFGAIVQFGVGSLTAYLETDPTSGQTTMLHTSSDIAALYVYDQGGSPVALLTDFNTSSFQYKYDPYGVATLQQSSGGNGVGQNPYAFKGGLQDRATGFVKFGLRWYNPVTGTWTQQDTLDSPLSVGNVNRYAYAGDDPVNNADPSGQRLVLEISGCIGICASISIGVSNSGSFVGEIDLGAGLEIGLRGSLEYTSADSEYGDATLSCDLVDGIGGGGSLTFNTVTDALSGGGQLGLGGEDGCSLATPIFIS